MGALMFNIKFLKWRKVNDTGVSTLKEAKEFIKNNSMETFLYERRMIEMEIAWEYSIYSVKLFFLYLMCSILIYIIFDKDSINLMLYNGMSYMGIPVRSSNGWNVLYLLSIIFNLYIYCSFLERKSTLDKKGYLFIFFTKEQDFIFQNMHRTSVFAYIFNMYLCNARLQRKNVHLFMEFVFSLY